LPQRNVECGAHSHTHLELDTLSIAAMKREVLLSKALLEEHLGRPVVSFAYPHGYHTRATEVALRMAGFTSACSVGSGNGRFGLKRLIIDGDTTEATLGTYLDGWLDAPSSRVPAWLRPSLRAGWREYRKLRATHRSRDRHLLSGRIGS